jgi:hypothetical protein
MEGVNVYNHYVDGKRIGSAPLREPAGPPSLRQLLEQNEREAAAADEKEEFSTPDNPETETNATNATSAGLAAMLRPVILPMIYDRIAKLKDEELLLLAAVVIIG